MRKKSFGNADERRCSADERTPEVSEMFPTLNRRHMYWGTFICVRPYLRSSAFQSLLVASLIAASTLGVAQERPSQPEPPSGWNAKQLAHAKKYMVAAAN